MPRYPQFSPVVFHFCLLLPLSLREDCRRAIVAPLSLPLPGH